jgi:hypothetical protein
MSAIAVLPDDEETKKKPKGNKFRFQKGQRPKKKANKKTGYARNKETPTDKTLSLTRLVFQVLRDDCTHPDTILPDGEIAGIFACQQLLKSHALRSNKKEKSSNQEAPTETK